MLVHTLAPVACGLLGLGACLEVGAISFFGLDALILGCFAGATVCGVLSRRPTGQIAALLGLGALALHVGLWMIA